MTDDHHPPPTHDNQPLDPNHAATLFFNGEPLLYVSNPTVPFTYDKHKGKPAVISPVPFEPPEHPEAVAHFTANPVYLASAYTPPAPGEETGASSRLGQTRRHHRHYRRRRHIANREAAQSEAQSATTPTDGGS